MGASCSALERTCEHAASRTNRS